MLNKYDDIKKRLGEPLWYDNYGVPRYDKFDPKLCGVYLSHIAFNEISCQYCGLKFKVAVEISRADLLIFHNKLLIFHNKQPTLPSKTNIGSFHYGDPPVHDCVGDTMNCETIRIIEFWERKDFEWTRNNSLEFEMEE